MNNQLNNYEPANPIIISSPEQAAKAFSVANLIMHPYAMERVEKYAQKMAQSKNMLPQAFHDDVSACEALIIQAASLGMNPEAIGRHAFKAPNGTINFEAKVFQAIAEVGAGVEFEEEYFGDWSKIINSTAQRNKQSLPDEKGVGIRITGTWYKNGEKRTKTLEVHMAQCMPRLSVNWNNDPQLQTYYAAIKKFMRRYLPAAIMGIFDNDDLVREQPAEREINPVSKKTTNGSVSIEDVFSGEVVNQKSQSALENDNTSIEDVFANESTVDEVGLSKFEELKSDITKANTLNDLLEVGGYVNEAYEAKEITDKQQYSLKCEYQKKKNSL